MSTPALLLPLCLTLGVLSDPARDARDHWAFRAPVRTRPPAAGAGWARHPLDRFVAERLEREGMRPAPEADRGEWLRRVSFDLRGLPPTPEEIELFRADRSRDAYERVVDRLLADPGYGERWASLWLDLARYADSRGFEKDLGRTIWPWRDWVVEALADDLPYDRFGIEQLAGDLLPGADERTVLATAFHRNTMTNDEGGTDDEEFRTLAVKDRVETSYQVWMGLTMGCARCHDHKYDPLSTQDYYASYAIFDQTADADRYDESPTLPVPDPEQARSSERLEAEAAALRRSLEALRAQPRPEADRWVREQHRLWRAGEPAAARWEPWEVAPLGTGPAWTEASELADWEPAAAWVDGVAHELHAEPERTRSLRRRFWLPTPRTVHLSFGSDDGLRVCVDGVEHLRREVQRGVAPDQDRLRLDLAAGEHELLLQVRNGQGPSAFWFGVPREGFAGIDRELGRRLAAAGAPLPADLRWELREIWEELHDEDAAQLRRRLGEVEAEGEALRAAFARVPVMRELPVDRRRTTRLHRAGNFLDPADPVSPAFPRAFVRASESSAAAPDRLAFARWLFAPDNPLTARVHVNRLWARLFGRGLVLTEEDFGTQGASPTHPELLDWLAEEFRRLEWSQKALLRAIVLSATYRQTARASALDRERDRFGELLARGPRLRLTAEMVRDQALFAAGLLDRRRGGPPVFPPQPEGIWQVVYDQRDWTPSEGPDRYRRALYTYWRRTAPYPAYLLLDLPTRDVCSARRIPTITPLQALLTWNDPAFVEAAQALARRARREAMLPEPTPAAGDEAGPTRVAAAIERAFVLVTSRSPSPAERAALLALHERRRRAWSADPEAARAFAGAASDAGPESVPAEELAALVACCSTILNLDAALVRS